MCGLVGYSSGDNTPFDVEKIKLLYLYNSLERGKDSSGLYSPKNKLIKSLEEGSKFISSIKETLVPDTLLIGHVRHTTVGQVNLNNAHPFHRGNCVLAHNGTLKNHWDLLRKRSISWNNYSVDSDVITGCIAHDKNAITVLSEIDGGAAVIFTDTEHPDTLYVFRNKERDLYKGYIGVNMYISSIKESLEYIECINIKEFKEDNLYTITNGQIIGNPRKIINKPYKDTGFSNNIANHNTKQKILKGLHCRVRARWTTTVKSEACNFTTEYNKYYIITSIIDDNHYEVQDVETQEKQIVPSHHFKLEEDVIYPKDMIRALFDIRMVNSKKNSEPVFHKDEIYECAVSYTDGDLGIKDPKNTKEVINVSKKLFVKLTKEELRELHGIPVIDTYTPNNSQLPALKKGTNLVIDNFGNFINVAEQLQVDTSDRPTIAVRIDELEDTLIHFFIHLDAKLETVKKLLENYDFNMDVSYLTDTMLNIKSLRELGEKTFNKILK